MRENDSVEFDVEQGDRGPKATNVRMATAGEEPAEEAPAEEAPAEEAPAEEAPAEPEGEQ